MLTYSTHTPLDRQELPKAHRQPRDSSPASSVSHNLRSASVLDSAFGLNHASRHPPCHMSSAPLYHALGSASSSSSSTNSTNSRVEGGGISWPPLPPTSANRPQRSETARRGIGTSSSSSSSSSGGGRQRQQGNVSAKMEQEQEQDDEVEEVEGEGECEEEGMDDETKRQKRLELNRKAAHESRKRKKAKYQELSE